MPWILLVVAGLLEVGWASALPSTEGFTRPAPTAAFVVAIVGSMYLLSKATESIPLGTAYAVWVGIGAAGAAIVGMTAYGESATPARLGFLALLLLAVVGLKVTAH